MAGSSCNCGNPLLEDSQRKIRRLAFRMVIALFIALCSPGAIPLATPPTDVQTGEAHLNFKCFFSALDGSPLSDVLPEGGHVRCAYRLGEFNLYICMPTARNLTARWASLL